MTARSVAALRVELTRVLRTELPANPRAFLASELLRPSQVARQPAQKPRPHAARLAASAVRAIREQEAGGLAPLFAKGLDPNAGDPPLLTIAAALGDAASVSTLLAHRATLDARGSV